MLPADQAHQTFVFYSWASDHPNGINRSFIEKALLNAAKAVRSDETITVDPVIDRDTVGVPGSPDIAATIFAKIERAQVFVADLTIVEAGVERPAPNPNVLIELGYALKVLGPERLLLVMNTAFGTPELLPFDLRMRRVTTYHKEPHTDDQGVERKRLESVLAEGLRTILQGLSRPLPGEIIQPRTPAQEAIEAVTSARADQGERVRRYMEALGEQVAALTPRREDEDSAHWEEQLLAAVDDSIELAVAFTEVAEAIVVQNAAEAAHTLYRGFSHLLELYRNPPGFSGPYQVSDFDFPRFIGHELFVTFCALLIHSGRWELVADLLEDDLYTRTADQGTPGLLRWTELSELVRLLEQRNKRLSLGRRLLHGDVLKARHTGTGRLAELLPLEQFTAGDAFLYLRGQLESAVPPQHIQWRPWSITYLEHPPRFLVESVRVKVAQRLCRPLGVPDIETWRTRMSERRGVLSRFFDDVWWNDPLSRFDISTIGTRG